MIVKLNGLEASVVVLNMAVMRQNVRNGFKRNYSKQQGTKNLKSYDAVKSTLEEAIGTEKEEDEQKLLEEARKIHEFHFNVMEVQTLSSFLNFYIPTLEDFLKKQGRPIQEEDQGQLDTMNGIKKQLDELKAIHRVG